MSWRDLWEWGESGQNYPQNTQNYRRGSETTRKGTFECFEYESGASRGYVELIETLRGIEHLCKGRPAALVQKIADLLAEHAYRIDAAFLAANQLQLHLELTALDGAVRTCLTGQRSI